MQLSAFSIPTDLLGSGEFYDRLEPLPSDSSVPGPISATPPTFSHFSSLYEEIGNGNNNTTDVESSLDIRGMSRPQDHTSSTAPRSYAPQMSHENSASSRHPLSPSDIEFKLFSPSGSASSRDSTLPRQQQRKSSYDSHTSSSSYPSDSAHHVGNVGVATDAPVRGSGRKDRNRPERGSGRSHTHQVLGGVSASPELTNGYATLPRVSSHHGDVGVATGLDSVASLENLRLADSESNSAFRRDNPGRISITKKSGCGM